MAYQLSSPINFWVDLPFNAFDFSEIEGAATEEHEQIMLRVGNDSQVPAEATEPPRNDAFLQHSQALFDNDGGGELNLDSQLYSQMGVENMDVEAAQEADGTVPEQGVGASGGAGAELLTESINTDVEENLMDGLGLLNEEEFQFGSQDSLGLSQIIGFVDPMTGIPPAAVGLGDEGSLGNEAVCLEKYPGPYNFSVIPQATKKTVYDRAMNKFFCDTGKFEFDLFMDFNALGMRYPLKDCVVRCVMVFTEPALQSKPVLKCFNCTETQRKLANPEDFESLQHIVRGAHSKTQILSVSSPNTGFKYVMIKLDYPQLGDTVHRINLIFCCRSSCKSDDTFGISRRPTALVFTLLSPTKEILGRSVVNLRICSAPMRDYKAERKQKQGKEPEPKAEESKGKRKGKKSNSTDQPPAKKDKRETRVNAEDHVDLAEPRPGCSRDADMGPPANRDKPHLSDFVFDFEAESKLIMQSSQESQSQSSSQDSVYDVVEGQVTPTREGVNLRKLAKDSRKIFRWLHAGNSIQRAAAVQVLDALKLAQRMCCNNRSIIRTTITDPRLNPPRNNPEAANQNGNPSNRAD